MRKRCTIIIPTHNRPQYLERCVRWFLELGCPIVIADSSAYPWASALRTTSGVKYVHRPGGFDVYPGKLRLALDAVATPLVAMCADDDFITWEGLEASATFLDAHQDYAACQGYAYLYQVFGARLALWPMVYPFHNVRDEAWIDRAEHAKSTVYYAVSRTPVLRKAVEFLARCDFGEVAEAAAGLFDTALTLSAARAGKINRVPVPFALREYSPHVSAVGVRYQTIVSRNIPDFYRSLFEHLMEGEEDPIVRQRLLKLLAADYAGQLSYDLIGSQSRKHWATCLTQRQQACLELWFRRYTALRMYLSRSYRPFTRVYIGLDYQRFRRFVLPASDRAGRS